MIDLVKVGAYVTLIGLFAVGAIAVFLGLSPSPTTSDEAAALAQAAMKAQVVQRLGWILTGIGLFTALIGSADNATAIDMKLETLVSRPRP